MIENGEPFLQKWNIGSFDLIYFEFFADQHEKFVFLSEPNETESLLDVNEDHERKNYYEYTVEVFHCFLKKSGY